MSTDYYSFFQIPKFQIDLLEPPGRLEVVANFKKLVKQDLKKDIEMTLLFEFLN